MSLQSRMYDDPSLSSDADIAFGLPPQNDISSDILDYEERKLQLQSIIEQMIHAAPSYDSDPVAVREGAAATAQRFLQVLPINRELPKVAPDGEGDLLFVWEPPHGNCIATVQEDMLHLVDQPGTAHAAHIDAQQFTGGHIPVQILHAIPMR